MRKIPLQDTLESRSNGEPLAAIRLSANHLGAGTVRELTRPISRSIVNDDYVIDAGNDASDNRLDRARLVVGRDQRSSFHDRRSMSSAGRTSTGATANVMTLTPGTMPIDRNRGYKEVKSRP
jgi:hypothetical protein